MLNVPDRVKERTQRGLIFSYSWEPSLEETIAEVEKGNIEPAYKGDNNTVEIREANNVSS